MGRATLARTLERLCVLTGLYVTGVTSARLAGDGQRAWALVLDDGRVVSLGGARWVRDPRHVNPLLIAAGRPPTDEPLTPTEAKRLLAYVVTASRFTTERSRDGR